MLLRKLSDNPYKFMLAVAFIQRIMKGNHFIHINVVLAGRKLLDNVEPCISYKMNIS